MKKNGKGGGSSSRTPSASASSRRRPETYEIGSPSVKRSRELGEDTIGTPTTAGASRPEGSEAEAAEPRGGGEVGGAGGYAPVPSDLEDTDSTFEKELIAAAKRVEAANARVDVATAGQRAAESPGKVRRAEGGGPGAEGDEEGGGGGVSPGSPRPGPRDRAGLCRRLRLLPTHATTSRWGWGRRGKQHRRQQRQQVHRNNHVYHHSLRGSLLTNQHYQPRQMQRLQHLRTAFRPPQAASSCSSSDSRTHPAAHDSTRTTPTISACGDRCRSTSSTGSGGHQPTSW